MQVTSLDYSSFLGRIAVGKVTEVLSKNLSGLVLHKKMAISFKGKVKELYILKV